MTRNYLTASLAALAVAFAGASADAKNKGNGKVKGHAKVHKQAKHNGAKHHRNKASNGARIIKRVTGAAAVGAATTVLSSGDGVANDALHCPPGLAKKNPPCVPPGLAKKQVHDRNDIYDVGDMIRDDYIFIEDPSVYDLDPGLTYWRVDDRIYAVDPDTGEVVAIADVLSAPRYAPGEVISGDYVVINNPALFNLDTDLVYWAVDDRIYAVDQDTAEVLAVAGLVSDLLD